MMSNHGGAGLVPFHKISHILSTLFISTMWTIISCESCDTGPGAIEQKTGDPLIWESIALNMNKDQFFKWATDQNLLGEQFNRKKACQDQYVLTVPDLDENEITERTAGNRRLTNCIVRTTELSSSSPLLEIRGEFIDERLNRLSFRSKPNEYDSIRKKIENRFGPGAKLNFKNKVMMEEEKIPHQIWRENKEVWLLTRAEQNTVLLVHQDWKTGMTLPLAPEASVRGKPVSLEDIGIGKLDLNAPSPKLDIPDAGSKQ